MWERCVVSRSINQDSNTQWVVINCENGNLHLWRTQHMFVQKDIALTVSNNFLITNQSSNWYRCLYYILYISYTIRELCFHPYFLRVNKKKKELLELHRMTMLHIIIYGAKLQLSPYIVDILHVCLQGWQTEYIAHRFGAHESQKFRFWRFGV